MLLYGRVMRVVVLLLLLLSDSTYAESSGPFILNIFLDHYSPSSSVNRLKDFFFFQYRFWTRHRKHKRVKRRNL